MRYKGENPIVLALPRGGVPVAYEVAKALEATLDLVLVRKIGAPGQPELGLGAVVDGRDPQLVLNEDLVRALRPDPSYIDGERQRQLAEIERRRKVYFGTHPPPDARGRVVIVVDDGIATGGTVKASLKALARQQPARLVLAVPVAPPETLEEIRPLADDLVCLAAPPDFAAVGLHYLDFAQTDDEEVIALLAEGRGWGRRASDQSSGEEDDIVAEAGKESFPASDPPAF
jgi:putative phosphoribosyl transferase